MSECRAHRRDRSVGVVGRPYWLLAALVLCLPAAAAAAGNIFEAEIVAAGYVERSGSMSQVSDTDACAALALEAPTVPNAVAYTISFLEDGDRYVWLRLSQPADSQRSVWVTLDGATPPVFDEPGERFDVTRGSDSGYTWNRVSLRGTGSVDAPQEDPRVFSIGLGNHTLAFGLPDADVRIDRFAITTARNYQPTLCDAYVDPPASDGGPDGGGNDGGPSAGDGGPFSGAIAGGCDPGTYWDLGTEECITPGEAASCAGRSSPWACLGLLALFGRRRRVTGARGRGTA